MVTRRQSGDVVELVNSRDFLHTSMTTQDKLALPRNPWEAVGLGQSSSGDVYASWSDGMVYPVNMQLMSSLDYRSCLHLLNSLPLRALAEARESLADIVSFYKNKPFEVTHSKEQSSEVISVNLDNSIRGADFDLEV